MQTLEGVHWSKSLVLAMKLYKMYMFMLMYAAISWESWLWAWPRQEDHATKHTGKGLLHAKYFTIVEYTSKELSLLYVHYSTMKHSSKELP